MYKTEAIVTIFDTKLRCFEVLGVLKYAYIPGDVFFIVVILSFLSLFELPSKFLFAVQSKHTGPSN